MENMGFRIPDHTLEARLARLGVDRSGALEQALTRLGQGALDRHGAAGNGLRYFLLPLAEFGLSADQLTRLAERVPEGSALDHREIYFDFRLDRWIRHLEPPTLAESLEEYLESAESPAEGMVFLRQQWRAFLRRHGADSES